MNGTLNQLLSVVLSDHAQECALAAKCGDVACDVARAAECNPFVAD